ncbi:MAG: xanthine dehydrogenase family protein subunit M [Planctomycetota bacterium]
MEPFTLVVPKDLEQASAAGRADGALLKAGGIDVLDRLKERVARPKEVVDLCALRAELSGIATEDSGLAIGAMTTLSEIAEHEALSGPALAALRMAADSAATPQIRNRATIGGNLLQVCRCWYLRSEAFACLHGGDGPACLAIPGENRYHAVFGVVDCARVHPSTLAPALLALGAEFATSLGGRVRQMPLAELFPKLPDARTPEHTLEPGEILTRIFIPAQPDGSRSSYAESRERQAADWPTTSAAVRLVIRGGAIESAAIVLGAVAPVPWPIPEAGAMLKGQRPSAELFERVAQAAFEGASALEHNAYKIAVGKGVLRAALHEAAR